MPTEPSNDRQERAESPANASSPPPAAPAAAAAGASRERRIVLVTLLVLLVIFVYHMIADRFTPYTSQAAIDTFLVQIAPEVTGPVVAVEVSDNRRVKQGDVLFRIDPRPFQIALRAAQANLVLATQAADASAAPRPAHGSPKVTSASTSRMAAIPAASS